MAQTPASKALEVVRSYESGNDIRQIISSSEGGRALRLLKRREETKARAEAEKLNIENETRKRKFSNIDTKFGGSKADDLEEEFKKQTVGLVSAEEFKAKREAIDKIIKETAETNKKGQRLRLQRKVNSKKLSFDDADMAGGSDSDKDSDEDSEEGAAPLRKHFGKDPSVNTAFLYDADREADLLRKKKALVDEYNRKQELQKQEKLEVTFSYWDGSGHRRSCVCNKGDTIAQFMQRSKLDLEKTDFPELRSVGVESLMYVKEDLIIPHNITFHDLIKTKARGKSGPLFNFDVHDDIRINNDVRVEKDESHAGKIVDRKWYDRNKHIFPASRWEMYDKNKTYDEYTIHGDSDLSKPLISTLRG